MPISLIEPQARENLIRLAEAYSAATGNKLITVGRYAHSDPRFFTDMVARHKRWIKQGKPDRLDADRKGSVTFRVYDKMLAWFYTNWPPDTEFPSLNDLFHKHQEDQEHGTKSSSRPQKAPQAARPEQEEGQAGSRGGVSATLARLRGVQETG